MPSPDKASILIVDDLPEKLLVLETVLEDLGENIVTARRDNIFAEEIGRAHV